MYLFYNKKRQKFLMIFLKKITEIYSYHTRQVPTLVFFIDNVKNKQPKLHFVQRFGQS